MNTTEAQPQTEVKPMRIIGVNSTRRDIRRSREYGLELRVLFTLGSRAYCTRCFEAKYGNVQLKLGTVGDGLPYATYSPTSINTNYSLTCEACKAKGFDSRWGSIADSLSISFYIKAARPSDIPSESQAQQMIARRAEENKNRGGLEQPATLNLEEILVKRVEDRFAAVERDIERVNIAGQASELIGWATKEADKQARQNIKWQERLDALKAELEAEQKRILADILQQLPATTDKDDREWSPAAIQLASERAMQHLPSPIGRFLEETSRPVKPKDVRLPGDPDDEETNNG